MFKLIKDLLRKMIDFYDIKWAAADAECDLNKRALKCWELAFEGHKIQIEREKLQLEREKLRVKKEKLHIDGIKFSGNEFVDKIVDSITKNVSERLIENKSMESGK